MIAIVRPSSLGAPVSVATGHFRMRRFLRRRIRDKPLAHDCHEPLRRRDHFGRGRAFDRISDVIGNQTELLGLVEIATVLNRYQPPLSPSAD